MIHKFVNLVSVGKFRDYQAAGMVNFHKLTVIYADNGSGKTTLTSVLRSLNLGQPEIIRKRVTTDALLPQGVQVTQIHPGNTYTHHTLRRVGWSATIPDIEIFDVHFIAENIFSGFDFSEDHRRKLHRFVLGTQGVAIKRLIERNKEDKTTSRQIQDSLIGQIIQLVGHGLTASHITDFLNLKLADYPDIDDRFKRAEAMLANARANVAIQRLPTLNKIILQNSGIDFERINTDIQSTIQTIQDEALKKLFANHSTDLANNQINNSQGWLRIGFGYIEAKIHSEPENINCPFCLQPINSDMDVIKAYSLQFNVEFNEFISRIRHHISTLQSYNVEALLLALGNVNETNITRITAWSDHLPTTVISPVFNILGDSTQIKNKISALVTTLQDKLQNLNLTLSTQSSTDLQRAMYDIKSTSDAYNISAEFYNSAIASFKSTIQREEVALQELDVATRIKKRFENAIDTLSIQLINEKLNLKTLETAYPLLVQQEEIAANTFFVQYKDQINHYLRDVFKTPFLIDDVAHVSPQGRATESKVNYRLTINGQDISFDPAQNNSTKECLSEGDKSTIALAFFLSKLDIEPLIAEKIVVIDDPLSSFDGNRRHYTCDLIKKLVRKSKQTIILSHNEFFLSDIYKDFGAAEKKSLKIVEDFINNSSRIEVLDLEEMIENSYFKHIKELQRFLAAPDLGKKEYILGLLRNIIEAHIKFKFYRQLSGIPANQQTFGRLIDELVTQAVIFRDPNTNEVIRTLRLINGVSCQPHHGEAVPDYITLGVNPTTMRERELANLIQDTFGLIDNRL